MWSLVDGETFCSKCNTCVEQTWRWFPKPSLYTHVWCIDCVTAALAEPQLVCYNEKTTKERI